MVVNTSGLGMDVEQGAFSKCSLCWRTFACMDGLSWVLGQQ